MKKTFLIIATLFIALLSHAQSTALQANKPMTAAQKTATELSRLYNLTAEQATQVKHIQDAKFEALAKLENLKATDLKKYIAKRLSTFETADNDLMVLLEERQITIFKQQQVEKSNKYDAIVGGMKKQGISEAEINKKLAETEF